ncbi:TRAFs-binding domain-containing protein [Agriterribacter sp.]|uniref:TRAFs-binding domain-containing protein n=1 Tax=Agriterribacter sp. TaxID=2821509 RepID=UPI002BEC6298|nr:TRAFs-binding domain-containing protein [Agriterribacter sp.]HRP56134.1 TRAFs-binding domain-containing protein [Agriterribacter sp.]
MTSTKKCFVVMGFGIKTDLATGRKLNLDKSYQALIKPVVESKNITCIRADEILHSGSIDLQMYQQLLSADIVIADLSTANVNAFYELGIRHALKPRTTIIMSEALLGYPFDVNHIVINRYTHLGDSIDYFEVLRFQKLLGDTIDTVINTQSPDSPVYTFIEGLIPPSLKAKANRVVRQIGDALTEKTDAAESGSTGEDHSLAFIIKQGEEALQKKQFDAAKTLFETALQMVHDGSESSSVSNNTYLIQRLALTTYQARQPNYIASLNRAIELLEKIDLRRTNDPETVALAGSIEKHLFEEGQGDEHLNNAILLYQRGYYLLHNRHNGINLAYLLQLRTTTMLDPKKEDKIADTVWAKRIRREVLDLCEKDLKKISNMESRAGETITPVTEEQEGMISEQKFWIAVNKAEAHFGLGEMMEYEQAAAAAALVKHEDWMMESFTKQLQKLSDMMKKQEAFA